VIDISINILRSFGADACVAVSVKRVARGLCTIEVPERRLVPAEILKIKRGFRCEMLSNRGGNWDAILPAIVTLKKIVILSHNAQKEGLYCQCTLTQHTLVRNDN
jgi:hypothetical protein